MITKQEYYIDKKSICNTLSELINTNSYIKTISLDDLLRMKIDLGQLSKKPYSSNLINELLLYFLNVGAKSIKQANENLDNIITRINNEYNCESEIPNISEKIEEQKSTTKIITDNVNSLIGQINYFAKSKGLDLNKYRQ